MPSTDALDVAPPAPLIGLAAIPWPDPATLAERDPASVATVPATPGVERHLRYASPVDPRGGRLRRWVAGRIDLARPLHEMPDEDVRAILDSTAVPPDGDFRVVSQDYRSPGRGRRVDYATFLEAT
jgi:hypothetical protein